MTTLPVVHGYAVLADNEGREVSSRVTGELRVIAGEVFEVRFVPDSGPPLKLVATERGAFRTLYYDDDGTLLGRSNLFTMSDGDTVTF